VVNRLAKSAAPKAERDGRAAAGPDVEPKAFENFVGYRLRLAYNVQVQRFAAVGGSFNIRPPQFAILKLLYSSPRLKQTDLTRALKKKHANTVTLLDELESRSLISRSTDPDDKRSRVLELTPAGKKLTETLLERHGRLQRHLRRTFGASRLQQLIELLDEFRMLDPDPNIDEID
jgi:DNA-binding MarR family transcriptional regulator